MTTTTSVATQAAAAPLDPALFLPEAIEAETAAFNAQIATLLATVPPVWTQPVAETRAAREEGRGPFGPLVLSDQALTRTIPGPAGDMTLRMFLPETVTGVYLHMHGGGWTLGGAHHADPLLEAICRQSQIAVLSVEYRLAPEHPYPAGPDDCEAAGLWLAEHAQAEFGSGRLLIGGDSAGAHLSVVTLLRLRDKHGFSGFSGANLVYGAYDLANYSPSVRQATPDTLILPPESIRWFTNQFLPDPAQRADPDVSPLWADLHGLPAALFTVGTLDPLVDDTLFMYSRWIAAGNSAELAIYPGGVHGFVGFPYSLAQRANRRTIDFLAHAQR